MALRTSVSNRQVIRDFGQALSFNGTSDFCTIPIVPSTTAFSVCLWINPTRLTDLSRILDFQDGGPTNGFTLLCNATNRLEATINNAGSEQARIVSPPLVISRWYHIVLTYQVNSYIMYFNGVNFASDLTVTMTTAATTLSLGKRATGASNYYQGAIDNLLFFNGVVLTPTQITNLYFRGAIPSGVSGHYTLNGNGNDSSGNGNNLTVTGGTYILGVM